MRGSWRSMQCGATHWAWTATIATTGESCCLYRQNQCAILDVKERLLPAWHACFAILTLSCRLSQVFVAFDMFLSPFCEGKRSLCPLSGKTATFACFLTLCFLACKLSLTQVSGLQSCSNACTYPFMSTLFTGTTDCISADSLWTTYQMPCRLCLVATEEHADCI